MIERTRASSDANFGFNAATAQYEDLVKSRVIDPAKVTAPRVFRLVELIE